MGLKRKHLMIFPVLLLCFLVVQSSSAELYPLTSSRYIATGQTQDWYYIQIHKLLQDDYIGISKNDLGSIGLASDNEFIGRMILVPAFKHPVNSEWYLCPVLNTPSVYDYEITDTSLWYSGGGSMPCYQYSNPSNSANADLDIDFGLYANPYTGKIKIAVNVTVNGVSPSDSGFAFLFFPDDPQKFRYAKIGTEYYDLAGITGQVPVDKFIEFFNSDYMPLKHFFDWEDMPIGTGVLAEIIQLGDTKGLLFGTYGYGASNFISIDPTYIVDYTPVPATHLVEGNNRLFNDSEYNYIFNVTTGVSDNLTSTSYEVRERIQYEYQNENGDIDGYHSFEPNSQKDVEANLFTVTQNFTDSQVCFYGQRILGNPTSYVVVNDQLTSVQVIFDFLPSWVCVNVPASYYTSANTTNYIGIRCVDCTSSRYFQIALSYDTQTGYHSGDYGNTYIPVGYTYFIRPTFYDSNLGKALEGRWSQTYDPIYNWWVRFYKTTTGTDNFTVNAYNQTSIAVGENVSKEITGTGWFNINVTSLMIYENDTGLNYSQLRLWSYYYQNVSEYLLRKEQNDSFAPTINYCYANTSVINCSETGRFYCNVTDDFDVECVNFTIDGNTTCATKQGDLWYVDVSGLQDGIYNLTLTNVSACDIVGQCNHSEQDIGILRNCSMQRYINIHNISVVPKNYSCEITWNTSIDSDSLVYYGFFPNFMPYNELDNTFVTEHSINITNLSQDTLHYLNITSSISAGNTAYNDSYNCTTLCINVWNFNLSQCYPDDQQQVRYYDSSNCTTKNNPSVPALNGTWTYCNYCSENLQYSDTACVDFYLNRTWYDLNYSTCCAVTNLTSDCSILYAPYNDTQYVYCGEFVEGSFNCQNLTNFQGNEKEYCVAYIPESYSNETFKCISYVKYGDEILQTNPEYKERAESLIAITNEEESRQYFEDQNGIVNFYFTKKNLLPKYNYTLGLKCSSPVRVLTSERDVYMDYESMEFVFSRTYWFMENWHYIVAGLILFILIVGTAFWLWKVAV